MDCRETKRHGLQDDNTCALCAQEPETADHLLVGCVIARQLWFALLSPIGLDSLVPRHDDALVDWWLHGRCLLQVEAMLTFETAILLVAWCLWKERNNRTFNRVSAGLRDML